MIYLLFLFISMLIAIPRIFFPEISINNEPHQSVEYTLTWGGQTTHEFSSSIDSTEDQNKFQENTLELEEWMFSPEGWIEHK